MTEDREKEVLTKMARLKVNLTNAIVPRIDPTPEANAVAAAEMEADGYLPLE